MLYSYQEGKHTYYRAQDGYDGPVRVVLEPSQWDILKYSHGKRPVEVCSINQVRDCESPDQLLDQLEKISAPAISGGWRPILDQDIYALYVARMNALAEMQHPTIRPEVSCSLSRHPLIESGVTFAFDGTMTLQLITLMQDIFDIVRFSDPEHPTRRRRLKSYFRVDSPNLIAHLMTGEIPQSVSEVRACIAVQSWRQQPLRGLSREEIDSKPEAFLFRDYWSMYDIVSKHYDDDYSKVLALWRTTERFLVYVRQLWLNGIKMDPFKPERFFRRQDEIEAFNRFVKPVDFGVDQKPEPI